MCCCLFFKNNGYIDIYIYKNMNKLFQPEIKYISCFVIGLKKKLFKFFFFEVYSFKQKQIQSEN